MALAGAKPAASVLVNSIEPGTSVRPIAMILFGAFVLYLAVGLLIGLAFVIFGVVQVQAMPVTLGARILLLPGATVLWPFVLSRWLKSGRAR